VPLILAGDEVGNGQDGNNNAYCQDNPIGWVDWSGRDRPGRDLTEFVGALTRLRRRYPQLRRHHWLEGRRSDGTHDVLWLTPASTEMTEQDWNFPEGRFLAYLLAADEGDEPLLIVLNAADHAIEITLPTWSNVAQWARILDTSDDNLRPDGAAQTPGSKLPSPALSVLVFAGKP
jgi:glycogen operon protein